MVTGALPFTGVCFTADVAADTCAATAAWMDACKAPGPPFSAAATAGTATAAATVATNAINVRLITSPFLGRRSVTPPRSGAADQPTKDAQPGRQVGRTIRRGLPCRRDGTRRITTSETKNKSTVASATRSGGTGDPPPD